MAGPIKPSEVGEAQTRLIPEPVFSAFNELIAENWNGSSSVVKQDDAVARIVTKMSVNRDHVYKHGWLSVEDAYRRAGWRVKYEKPAYNETGPATFTFTTRGGRDG